MTIHRYKEAEILISNQDPLVDLQTWLSFLCSREFTADILVNKHGFSSIDAKSRTKQIIPHAQIASKYLEQGISGPANISFLSLYYAVLNLLKIYILIGPHHADLPANRWHGATYNGLEKDSHSIATELITIKKGGVLPLFYRTVTGNILTASQLQIKIRDVLPFVSGVSHEYELATNQKSSLFGGSFDVVTLNGVPTHRFRLSNSYAIPIKVRSLKVLKKFSTAKAPLVNQFHGPSVASTPNARASINCNLIYDSVHGISMVPSCTRHMEMFEELPIALLFFYLSNICRYKPEFLEKLQESRYWPMLVSCRTNSLHAFLRCFWSFINQKSVFIQRH